MKECWDEGALRTYLDRELPPEEMTRTPPRDFETSTASSFAQPEKIGRYLVIQKRAQATLSLVLRLSSFRFTPLPGEKKFHR